MYLLSIVEESLILAIIVILKFHLFTLHSLFCSLGSCFSVSQFYYGSHFLFYFDFFCLVLVFNSTSPLDSIPHVRTQYWLPLSLCLSVWCCGSSLLLDLTLNSFKAFTKVCLFFNFLYLSVFESAVHDSLVPNYRSL